MNVNKRDELLRKAIADVRTWCAPSDTFVLTEKRTKRGVVRRKSHPDTYWIELFDPSSDITRDDAKQFLVSFQLANRVGWN